MFDDWRKRRALRRKIASLKEEVAERRVVSYYASLGEPERRETLIPVALKDAISHSQRELAALETDRLMRKARRRGIQFPKEPSWWWEDTDYNGNDVFYLTDVGIAGASRLIREDRRATIEWWTKIIVPLLTTLISILSLLVALVSVSRK